MRPVLMTWLEAQSECTSRGGELVTVISDYKQRALAYYVRILRGKMYPSCTTLIHPPGWLIEIRLFNLKPF